QGYRISEIHFDGDLVRQVEQHGCLCACLCDHPDAGGTGLHHRHEIRRLTKADGSVRKADVAAYFFSPPERGWPEGSDEGASSRFASSSRCQHCSESYCASPGDQPGSAMTKLE